jgi:endonuclease YncB( thermonuclease family)
MIFNERIFILYFFILTVFLLQIDGFLFNKKTTSTSTTSITTTTLSITSIPKSTSKLTISSKSLSSTSSKALIKSGGYKVTKVLDGDTVYAKSNIDNKEIKIRFRCVDAPEKSQEPWGPKSINKLLTILPVNSEINLNKTR